MSTKTAKMTKARMFDVDGTSGTGYSAWQRLETTGNNGHYAIDPLAEGGYRLTVTRPGVEEPEVYETDTQAHARAIVTGDLATFA